MKEGRDIFLCVRRGAGAAIVAGVCALMGVPRAMAWQTEPAPAPTEQAPADRRSPVSDPQLTSEGVEGVLESMRKRVGAEPAPIAPTLRRVPVATSPEAGQARAGSPDLGVPGARRLREGTFLSRRGGTLVRARTGDWIFVARPGTEGTVDRPMIVLPSQELERLEGAIGPGMERPGVSLSGQVFVYRGREYLLLVTPSAVVAEPSPEGQGAEGVEGPPAPARAGDAADLLRDLESRQTPARALSKGPLVAPSGDEDTAAVPESSLMTARRGRVVRLGDGVLAFTPDNDTDTTVDHALVLLPCQTMSRMEEVSLWRGDGVTMLVSGRVLAYHGRRYLLPTMVVMPPPTEMTPLQ